jgi:transcriptional regulator with XRE-family HTH domain
MKRGSIPGLPEALTMRRLSLRWSQADLEAEASERGLRVTRIEISRYETGAATPGVRILAMLAVCLETTIDDLLREAAKSAIA